MKGASVQPGHHQRPLLELAVHVGGGEPGGTGSDGEPCGAKVLRLHREQPVDDLEDTIGWRPDQLLSRQPTCVTLALQRRHGR